MWTIKHGWGYKTIDRSIHRTIDRPSSQPNCRRLHQTPLDLFGCCVYGWLRRCSMFIRYGFNVDFAKRSAWSCVLLFGKSAVKDRKIIWINTNVCTHTSTHQRLYHARNVTKIICCCRCLWNISMVVVFFCFFPVVAEFRCVALHRLHNSIIWSCVLDALYLVKHMWIDNNKYMREDQITDLFFPCNRHLFDDSIRREKCTMVWCAWCFSCVRFVPFFSYSRMFNSNKMQVTNGWSVCIFFGYFSIKIIHEHWSERTQHIKLVKVETFFLRWIEKQFCTHDLIDHPSFFIAYNATDRFFFVFLHESQ